jgi:hypothetical protein
MDQRIIQALMQLLNPEQRASQTATLTPEQVRALMNLLRQRF